mmetsp:Transcript_49991/g.106325  ORF Transcript_49991/g.106325 Transcript_49991/m.106325 type:complete len:151 (+) Transcript_49991:128-580(+)|eukprot:CAMPEP_0172550328 /NCGR_PEP_ID=MMETSP1067-20121228/28441_1 /TAXON_ID=265564 ORGANISM="Thalassiosira punctigera, Strain Tpunct2005C2" /NCGR_SAMPLE_ID=MMETSP1067 /ASSEMBLY_ACC=CAM_ASM_000444 /LENGTH=150 /DNA_ID=CAMNT_0013337865 /DNA_START=127 /DNA_END=579 /DNA_ORIENTATION=+
MTDRLIYIGMSADIIHVGHVNIIETANKMIADGKADRLVVGLLTCEAIEAYKRKPIVPWEARRRLLLALKGVDTVEAQTTLDYEPNLRRLKPVYCIHGSDWNDPRSAQYATRQNVIDTLQDWGGELIEPEYTEGISTTHIIDEIASRAKS